MRTGCNARGRVPNIDSRELARQVRFCHSGYLTFRRRACFRAEGQGGVFRSCGAGAIREGDQGSTSYKQKLLTSTTLPERQEDCCKETAKRRRRGVGREALKKSNKHLPSKNHPTGENTARVEPVISFHRPGSDIFQQSPTTRIHLRLHAKTSLVDGSDLPCSATPKTGPSAESATSSGFRGFFSQGQECVIAAPVAAGAALGGVSPGSGLRTWHQPAEEFTGSETAFTAWNGHLRDSNTIIRCPPG